MSRGMTIAEITGWAVLRLCVARELEADALRLLEGQFPATRTMPDRPLDGAVELARKAEALRRRVDQSLPTIASDPANWNALWAWGFGADYGLDAHQLMLASVERRRS